MGKDQTGTHDSGFVDSSAQELSRAMNRLRSILAVPPLTFLEAPEQTTARAPAAIQVGSGPALHPEYQEIASFVRGDWRAVITPIQNAVVYVCEFAESPQLTAAMSTFVGIVQKLAAVVSRHDEEVRIRVGNYRRNGPPQIGGPLQWQGQREAERTWRLKTQGPDVYGTTFVHYGSDARKDLREAWQALVAVTQQVQTDSAAGFERIAQRAANDALQRGVRLLEENGSLPPQPKTWAEREAAALNLISTHAFTGLRELSRECARLGWKGMSTTSLQKRKKIRNALDIAKGAKSVDRTVPYRQRDGGRVSPQAYRGKPSSNDDH